jgi:hypothetical protein
MLREGRKMKRGDERWKERRRGSSLRYRNRLMILRTPLMISTRIGKYWIISQKRT